MNDGLRNVIIEANRNYRLGRPTMSDLAFDQLCEQYAKTVSKEEYDDFRKQLHEDSGKVRHPFIMGSLNKLKSDEPESVIRWLTKYAPDYVSVSAKVDGISCRLHYDKNGLVSATTRGDGYFGIDCTEKVQHVKGIKMISAPDPNGIDIRGELVIKDIDFVTMGGQFANPRNACAGIMNQKTADLQLLSKISFIAYEIMGGKLSKHSQFEVLDNAGFETPWHREFGCYFDKDFVDSLYRIVDEDSKNFGYPTDGLVLSSPAYLAENKYIPDAQCAFKINAASAITEVLGITWGDPSKDGRMTPVAELKPVEIAGSTISRVTLNNFDWMSKMGISEGSVVRIIKSGDVIPKVVEVLDNTKAKSFSVPHTCHICGAKTVLDGTDIRCTNENCNSQKIERMLTFIENIGIKRISKKTLENWGIRSMERLLSFTPNPNYKMEVHFAREIGNKILQANEVDLFVALPFKDLAEITLSKIISYYGYFELKNGIYKDGYPAGVGEATMEAFKKSAAKNFQLVDLIKADPRYLPSKPTSAAAMASLSPSSDAPTSTGPSICFTGALVSMTRNEAKKRAIEAGYIVKDSVTKGLEFLCTNDPTSGSTKAKKAAEFGTKIITEEEFLSML